MLVRLLHTQVVIELLSFYVNKSLYVRGDIMCHHVLQAGLCDLCQSPGSTSAGEGLEKQPLNKKLNETLAFFLYIRNTQFSTLVCKNSEMDSALLFRILAVNLLTINIVLCWLYSCYCLFPAFMGFFCKVTYMWSKIGSFSPAICKLMEQSTKM